MVQEERCKLAGRRIEVPSKEDIVFAAMWHNFVVTVVEYFDRHGFSVR